MVNIVHEHRGQQFRLALLLRAVRGAAHRIPDHRRVEIGQQPTGEVGVNPYSVIQNHMRELVQDDLVPVQGGGAGLVKDKVRRVSTDPDPTRPVRLGFAWPRLDDQSALALALQATPESLNTERVGSV
jgi:hypothetical protein